MNAPNPPNILTLRARCPSCRAILERNPLERPPGLECRRCSTGVWLQGPAALPTELKNCQVCNCAYFYIEKDFPKFFRFLFLGIGIVLSFFTYGISLLVVGALDLILYRILPFYRVCYLCKTEYRGFPGDEKLEFYDPHKGVAYDARGVVPP